MMGDATTLLPDDIKQSWKNWLDQADMGPLQRQSIEKVVDYALPPVCYVSVLSAATVFDRDHPEDNTVDSIQTGLARAPLDHAQDRPSKISYPLFYTLTHTAHLGANTPLNTLCRQQMSDWFAHVSIKARAGLYYQHLIKCRHIFEILCQANIDSASNITQRLGFLVRLASSSELASRIDTKPDSYQLFCEFSERHRDPGVRVRRFTSRQVSSGRRAHDRWHDQHLSTLKNVTTSAADALVLRVDHDSDKDDVAKRDKQPCGIRAVPSPHRASADDDTLPADFQRPQFSTLTPHDDQVLVRHLVRAAASATIAHESDLQRLPAERITALLDSDMSDLQRAMVLLLIATGLPVKRLTTLRLAQTDFMQPGSTLPSDQAPRWIPTYQTLAYRLTDGPAENPVVANRWIVLRLPAGVGDHLTILLSEAGGDENNVVTAMRCLKRFLTRYSRERTGVNMTPNRLVASSWTWRRAAARDDVAAQWLSGTLGLGLSAPAAYRRVARQELQDTFDQVLTMLGVPVDRGPSRISPLLVGWNEWAGSTYALSPSAFVPVFRTLRTAVGDAYIAQQHPLNRGVAGRDAWVDLAQRLAAHTYLGLLLATGTRPVGPSTQHRFSGSRMWIRDKASSQGNESRVVPIVPPIGNALHCHRHWATKTMAKWQHLGGVIKDLRSGQRDTPAWFSPGRGKNTLIIRDLQHRDVACLLSHLPSLPASVAQWPDNVARHSLASWLRVRCTDADIDMLLGHARGGVTMTLSHASASVEPQRALRRALTEWIGVCGYHALAWEAL